MRLNQFLIYSLFIFSISCSSDKHIRTYKLEKIKISKESTLKVTDSNRLNYIKPDNWIISSGSSMRLLSFSIPYSEGMGDLSVIKLNSEGGGLESNVNRWRRQLDLPALNINDINKDIVVIEQGKTKYQILEIVNKNDGRAFICAIFSLKNSTYFVKVSLHVIGIAEIKSDFIKFCSSLIFPKN